VSHCDKLSTGALLARFLGLARFDGRSVEPEFISWRMLAAGAVLHAQTK
jgi:hypothetical protein